MGLDLNAVAQNAVNILIQVALKILGATLIWIIGRRLIAFAQRLIGRSLNRQRVDNTLMGYIHSSVGVLLTIALVVALLGFFGIETTTFAAMLAAAGIAIGAAWSGLLSNFAAGMFLVILRPFKVGDVISAAGVVGRVRAIGLFGTTLDSLDNVLTVVGNGKIFADTIQNFSANPYRRVDLLAQIDHTVDPNDAIRRLKQALAAIPNVCKDPAPEVEILQFSPMGPVLAVRPYANNENYWQVYFDANRAIRDTFAAAGYATPETRYAVRGAAGASAGA